MKKTKLTKHSWTPIEESKGTWGYHKYMCKKCKKETHIGLDIDYDAVECKGENHFIDSSGKPFNFEKKG